MKEGTLVDATIIEAPPSTKNAEKSRDLDMRRTKKGNEWPVSQTQAESAHAFFMCCVHNLNGSR